jgi:hypothetical protein
VEAAVGFVLPHKSETLLSSGKYLD